MEGRAKIYDLEERTFEFAKNVKIYVNKLIKTIPNIENGKQLIRSAGSVGANYIEANESFSDKDFIYRIKICKKEVKESRFWLKLSDPVDEEVEKQKYLIQESEELMRIFASIIRNKIEKINSGK